MVDADQLIEAEKPTLDLPGKPTLIVTEVTKASKSPEEVRKTIRESVVTLQANYGIAGGAIRVYGLLLIKCN